jgi:abhydrolase domain-containing protein 6
MIRRNAPLLATLSLLLSAFFLLSGCEKIEDSVFDAEMAAERGMNGLELNHKQVGDIEWVYLANEWKPGQPVIVLLHGFSADKTSWPRFAGKLGDGYNILVPDLPGHGETTQDPTLDYGIEPQVQRLLGLLDALGVDKFHIAGNSMGGAIAARTAAMAPARVLSVGLFDAAGVHRHASELDKELEAGRNPLIVGKPGDFDTVMAWAVAEPPFMPWPVRSVMERRGMARAAINAKIFGDLRNNDSIIQESILPQVTAPALVLWGDQDRLLNVANAAEFAALMPNARAVIMKGIGHMPMIEDPAESARIYLDFISGR